MWLRKNRLIYVLIIILALLSFYFNFFTPSWWRNASLTDFKKWYPSHGYLMFFIINSSTYLALLLMFFVINWKRVIKYIIQFKSEKKMIIYGLIIIVLFIQYGYSLKNEEPFPAIIMPRFKNGYNSNTIVYQKVFILIKTDELDSFVIDAKLLFEETPLIDSKKAILSDQFLNKELDSDMVVWVKNKIQQRYPQVKLKEMTFIKNIDSFRILPNLKKDSTFSIECKTYAL